ncbi:L,D-transpeptidase [Arthrobacter cavernae]|uniref:L,D-transpeptidase family protein n=1 Tax=Arthrobacter cavernae TaxID=2817681 RepID=A0A939KIC8_9MICC|nr:Ig-like domain-containing protein [Arthrobacter cavernae]MBO1266504.1 L,D-transpeptidase family protein [Arthrobacter cavernae]
MTDVRKRKTGKILGIVGICAAIAAGGIGIATAPNWAGGTQTNAGSSQGSGEGQDVVVKPVELGITPLDGAREWNPVAGPQIKAVNGTLKDVVLAPLKGGTPVKGSTSADASSWTTLEPLKFNTEYSYAFTLVDGAGRETRKTQTFTTVSAANEADASIYPSNGSTVGSGQPIEINFSEPVADKAAMEQLVKVTVSSGQPVAWHWYSNQKVRIRPETFWASNTQVTVDMKLLGVDFGNKMIGNGNVTSSFTTGPQRVAVVDDVTKTMNVYFDGQLVKTAPVTLGSPDWLSPTGYAVIMEQERHSKFNAGSIGLKPGDKGYYPPLVVEYANRLTSSGVYVHQALESAWGAVGRSNVSHGCVGLLPADAAWFFNNMSTGDVVQVLNTGAPAVEPLEGFGDWNMAWASYAQR